MGYKHRESERFRSARSAQRTHTSRYLQRLPLYGVAFPNPRPPGSRAGLKDEKKKKILQSKPKLVVTFDVPYFTKAQ